jgi:hypothetical protein
LRERERERERESFYEKSMSQEGALANILQILVATMERGIWASFSLREKKFM